MVTEDMHPEDVRAAIRKTGVTLTSLAESAGYSESAVRRTLRVPWPAIERIIAKQIGCQPNDIWPSRYHPDGSPRSRASKPKHRRALRRRHRQIEARTLT